MLHTAAVPQFGVNGLKVSGSTLFFTNSAQGIFAKVDINADGTAAGQVVVIANAPAGSEYDDFVLDQQVNAYLTTGSGNSIEEISPDGKGVIVAGNANSTDVPRPTAVEFGRTPKDEGVLYVSTSIGELVAVDTKGSYTKRNHLL